MENECEALPGVAYPGVRDNHSTINTKTGYDDDEYSVSPKNWTVVTFLSKSNKSGLISTIYDILNQ